MNATAPLVVDASVAVKWVIQETHSPEARQLLADHLGQTLLVPPHFRGEVTNALYRRVYRTTNPITPAQARQALHVFWQLAIPSLEPPDLYQAAYDLAERFAIPRLYDCLYVVLAHHTGATCWTADQNLLNTLGTSAPWVRFIGDYPLPTT